MAENKWDWLADADFKGLPEQERQRVFNSIASEDQDYAGLPPTEKQKVRSHYVYGPEPTVPPAPTAPEGVAAPAPRIGAGGFQRPYEMVDETTRGRIPAPVETAGIDISKQIISDPTSVGQPRVPWQSVTPDQTVDAGAFLERMAITPSTSPAQAALLGGQKPLFMQEQPQVGPFPAGAPAVAVPVQAAAVPPPPVVPVVPGNIDIFNRPAVQNPDGTVSSVRSKSWNFDGKEVLLPTVSEDGRIMGDDEAVQQYRNTGQHLGVFATPVEANAYAEWLHQQQAAMGQNQAALTGKVFVNPAATVPDQNLQFKEPLPLGWDPNAARLMHAGAEGFNSLFANIASSASGGAKEFARVSGDPLALSLAEGLGSLYKDKIQSKRMQDIQQKYDPGKAKGFLQNLAEGVAALPTSVADITLQSLVPGGPTGRILSFMANTAMQAKDSGASDRDAMNAALKTGIVVGGFESVGALVKVLPQQWQRMLVDAIGVGGLMTAMGIEEGKQTPEAIAAALPWIAQGQITQAKHKGPGTQEQARAWTRNEIAAQIARDQMSPDRAQVRYEAPPEPARVAPVDPQDAIATRAARTAAWDELAARIGPERATFTIGPRPEERPEGSPLPPRTSIPENAPNTFGAFSEAIKNAETPLDLDYLEAQWKVYFDSRNDGDKTAPKRAKRKIDALIASARERVGVSTGAPPRGYQEPLSTNQTQEATNGVQQEVPTERDTSGRQRNVPDQPAAGVRTGPAQVPQEGAPRPEVQQAPAAQEVTGKEGRTTEAQVGQKAQPQREGPGSVHVQPSGTVQEAEALRRQIQELNDHPDIAADDAAGAALRDRRGELETQLRFAVAANAEHLPQEPRNPPAQATTPPTPETPATQPREQARVAVDEKPKAESGRRVVDARFGEENQMPGTVPGRVGSRTGDGTNEQKVGGRTPGETNELLVERRSGTAVAADQSARAALDRLEVELQKDTGVPRSQWTIVDAPNRPDIEVAKKIALQFGKIPVVVRPETPDGRGGYAGDTFNSVVSQSSGKHVFLNVHSNIDPSFAVVHEIGHLLPPDLHRIFLDEVKKHFDLDRYAKDRGGHLDANGRFVADREDTGVAKGAPVLDEAASDTAGQMLHKSATWLNIAAHIEASAPGKKSQAFLRKAIHIIDGAILKAKATFGIDQPTGDAAAVDRKYDLRTEEKYYVDKYISDLRTMRRAAVDAFVETQKRAIQNQKAQAADRTTDQPRRQIRVEDAKKLTTKLELPNGPRFKRAVENTDGARITDDGLVINLVRFQKPNQEGERSVRTGVFYLPGGSRKVRYYRGDDGISGNDKWYGGSARFEGETLLRRPMVVVAPGGGAAPVKALQVIRGARAAFDLENQITSLLRAQWSSGGEDGRGPEDVADLLKLWGADPNLAPDIWEHSQVGNRLRFAIQEAVIAHVVRDAGYDAVVALTRSKAPRIQEIFDVREVTYPSTMLDAEVHPRFRAAFSKRIEPSSSAGADSERELKKAERLWLEKGTDSPYFKRWFGDSRVVNKDGSPLVVYHGTRTREDFSEFDTERPGEAGAPASMGSHFGTAPQANATLGFSGEVIRDGERYGFGAHQNGARILPEYLSLQNPVTLPDMNEWNNPREWVDRASRLPADVRSALVSGARGAIDRFESGDDLAFADEARQILEDAGYDGVRYRNNYEASKTGGYSWIAFRPEQIKSATGQRGTFSADSPDIRQSKRQDDRIPGFYSQLERVIEKQMPNSATPDLVRAITRKQQNGVKAEELRWVDLDSLLERASAEGRKVTKQEVLDHIRENNVMVTEVMKGGARKYSRAAYEQAYLEVLDLAGQERQLSGDGREALRAWLENPGPATSASVGRETGFIPENYISGDAGAKFNAYQLPGWKNYFELLLTMPSQAPPRAFRVDGVGRQAALIDTRSGETVQTGMFGRMKQLALERNTALAGTSPQYLGPHYDETNILAHIRVNSRTTPGDGVDVIVANKGKRAVRGQSGTSIRSFATLAEAERFAAVKRDGGYGVAIEPTQVKTLHIEEVQSDWNQEGRKHGYAVLPSHRVVEDSLDGQKWFFVIGENGEQLGGGGDSPERARASALNEMKGVPDNPLKSTGSWSMLAIKRMIRYAAENGYDKLTWTTGEQQAERYPREEGDPEKEAQLRGMQGFYDNILPNEVNKYVKKWGVRVGESRLATEADKNHESGPIVHSIDITPAMRESVMGEGQPLYSVRDHDERSRKMSEAQQRRQGTGGRLIGSPNITTDDQLKAVQKLNQLFALRAQDSKYWYEESGRAILALAGGDADRAERIAYVLAAMSPKQPVPSNFQLAMKAINHYELGLSKKAFLARNMTLGKVMKNVADYLYDKKEMDGVKRHSFFGNTMAEIDKVTGRTRYQGTTVDAWMMRLWGFPTDTPSDEQYAFIQRQTEETARRLNKNNKGPQWTPYQVQAAQWAYARSLWGDMESKVVARADKLGINHKSQENKEYMALYRKMFNAEMRRQGKLAAGKTFTPGYGENFADVMMAHPINWSMENIPGHNTGVLSRLSEKAEYQDRAAYHFAVEEALNRGGFDRIGRAMSYFPLSGVEVNPSSYKNEAGLLENNPATRVPLPAPAGPGGERVYRIHAPSLKRDAAYAMIRGLLTHQEAVSGYREYVHNAKIADSNGAEFSTGRPLTVDEVGDFITKLNQYAGERGFQAWGFAPYFHSNGVTVVNVNRDLPNKEWVKMSGEMAGSGSLPGAPTLRRFAATTIYKTGGSDGSRYRNWLQLNGYGEALRAAEADLAPDLNAINNRFSADGWGNSPEQLGLRYSTRVGRDLAGGDEPADGEKERLWHYSNSDVREDGIQRRFAGAGAAGQERSRFVTKNGELDPDSAQVHLYTPGGYPEPQVVRQAKYLNEINAKLKILDLSDQEAVAAIRRAVTDRTGSPAVGARDFIDELRAQGYDGMRHFDMVQVYRDIAPEEISRTIDLSQDKVPLNDRGALMSVRQAEGDNDPGRTRLEGTFDDMPGMDKFRRKVQDNLIRLVGVQREIEGAVGRPLREDEDVYVAEELRRGKTGYRLKGFEERHIRPLAKRIIAARKAGAGYSDVSDFLYATHALERNRHLRELYVDHKLDALRAELDLATPSEYQAIADEIDAVTKMAADGKVPNAGMSDEVANGILRDLGSKGLTPQLEQIRDIADQIGREKLAGQVADGLISQGQADTMAATYQHYVPLKGTVSRDAMQELSGGNRPRSGRGLDIRGNETKRSFGRKTKASHDILSQLVMDAEEAIVRGEKNRVDQTLLKLVEDFPNSKLWELNPVNAGKVLDKDGVPRDAPNAFSAHNDPEVIGVKRGGRQYWIRIKDADLARALKNTNTTNPIPILSTATRLYSQLRTGWNPEFWVSNFMRDFSEAGINLSTEEYSHLASRIMRSAPKAIAGIYASERGHQWSAEWRRNYEEYQKHGGKVSFIDLRGLEAQQRRIKSLIGEGVLARGIEGLAGTGASEKYLATKQHVRKVADLVSAINDAIENGVRLSAFVAARDAGMSPAKAASLAKNLTLNFERHGELGPALSSAYAFSGASIQGTARMAKTLTSPRAWKVLGGLAAVSAMAPIWNTMIGGEDDEDGQTYWDKIDPEFKSRNLILFIPGMSPKDGYARIGMPYGFIFAHVFGTALSDNIILPAMDRRPTRRQVDVPEAAKRLALSVVGAFNPFSGVKIDSTDDLKNLIVPSVLKPLFQISDNKDWSGRQIMPENMPFGVQKPDSELYFKGVSPTLRDAARKLNEATGGNRVRKGKIDISPETMELALKEITGGVGRFGVGTLDTVNSVRQGKKPELRNVPFVRSVAGAVTDNSVGSEYWGVADEVQQLLNESKMFADKQYTGNEHEEFKAKHRALLDLGNALKASRRAIKAISDNTSLSPEDARRRTQKIQKDFLKRYRVAKNKYGTGPGKLGPS